MQLLTLYTWPKSFNDPHIARIQRNAVRSWLQLEPKPTILIFGEEPGVLEYCTEFGLTHVPDRMEVVDRTVRIRDLACKAEAASDTLHYCFINADIILTSSFMKAVREVPPKFSRFLFGASPWNLDILEDLRFEPNWEPGLIERTRAANAPRGRGSSDLFLYPKGYLAKAPELIIGRYYIDCGLMWQTRNRGDALIDGTPGVFTIHQNHDYTHVISQYRKHESAGARWNLKMIGGPSHLYTWCNATHHYTENGIRHYWAGRFNRMSTWRGPGGNQAQFSNSWLWMTIVRLTRPLRSAIGLVNPR